MCFYVHGNLFIYYLFLLTILTCFLLQGSDRPWKTWKTWKNRCFKGYSGKIWITQGILRINTLFLEYSGNFI